MESQTKSEGYCILLSCYRLLPSVVSQKKGLPSLLRYLKYSYKALSVKNSVFGWPDLSTMVSVRSSMSLSPCDKSSPSWFAQFITDIKRWYSRMSGSVGCDAGSVHTSIGCYCLTLLRHLPRPASSPASLFSSFVPVFLLSSSSVFVFPIIFLGCPVVRLFFSFLVVPGVVPDVLS